MKVWIAVQESDEDGYHETIGVFSSAEKAMAACAAEGDAVFGPHEIDRAYPRETVFLSTAYWPDFEWLHPENV